MSPARLALELTLVNTDSLMKRRINPTASSVIDLV